MIGTVTGCGSRNPLGVVKVTGTVTVESQPLAGALITFLPKTEGEGLAASATTDSNGMYSLTTQGAGDIMGAVPGEYGVTVVKNESVPVHSGDNDVPAEERKIVDSYALPKVIRHLPAKYEAPSSSGLSALVEKKGKNIFHFELDRK
jgi:hypothetical protein